MSQPNVVSIGGVQYDSHSGQAIGAASEPQLKRVDSVHARGVHASQQRSKTLNRRIVKHSKPTPVTAVVAPARKRSAVSMDMRPVVKRSPHISKFAKDPQRVTAPQSVADTPAKPHPIEHSIRRTPVQHPAVPKPAEVASTQPSARDIKHAALGKALANAKTEPAPRPQAKKRRVFSVGAASLGILLLTGYFTYLNMPNLSVRVAATQAGIEASYPEYRPVGYRLNGPVVFQDGQVSMEFASNSGPLAFSLNQSRSSWDSSALLEKYVDPRSEGKYATYSDGGLTIYTYGTDAAWMNGGVLHTIEGSATLSNEQIRRIATSM